MKQRTLSRPRFWFRGIAAGLTVFAPGQPLLVAAIDPSGLPWREAADLGIFSAGYEGVLGTSMDLLVAAPRAGDAAECARAIRTEIERLRRICSTYDPASEISGAMRGEPITSPELAAVFSAYQTWAARTGGLIDLNLGGVIAEWTTARRSGRLPDEAALARASARPRAWNVDALGKAFILDRAVELARRIAPAGLLNIGGDVRAWGHTAWTIAIADPRRPADNAAPIAEFVLRNAAVATSGGYARTFQVGAETYSHLIDPRTQRPVPVAGSASVVAPDAVTANALSTAASIAGPVAGASLAEAHGASGYYFVGANGVTTAGGILSGTTLRPVAAPVAPDPAAPAAPAPAAPAKEAPAAAAPWPAGYEVTMPVTLKKHTGPREIFRPYVVVWVENMQERVVRTVTLWGTEPRWQGKLSMWSYQARPRPRSTNGPGATTRATRAPGSYLVTWDGKDDFGDPVPAGTYKLSLEICREDGHHVLEEVTLTCGAEPVSGEWRETAESAAATVRYGPAPAQP